MSAAFKKSIRLSLLALFVVGGVLGFSFGIKAYPEIFNVVLLVNKNTEILPDEAIQINFSQPVLAENYKNKISIVPNDDFNLQWKDSNKVLVISPKKFWRMEMEYMVTLPAGRSRFYSEIGEYKFNFTTIKYPVVSSVMPKSGSKDVVFDIEDPIVVDFENAFDNFWIDFKFNPPIEVAYEVNSKKNQFKIIPKTETQAGIRYNMSVLAKYKKYPDDNYKKILTSNFEILPPPPINWDSDLTSRVAQAKKFTRAKIKEGKYMDINLASQVMTIFEQGKVLDAFVVSSGKHGMDTPKGSFKIENKAARPWSAAYGLFMPNWMALVPSGKFGIHELPEWPGGYKEGESHLGTPVSHGCVRLGVGAAKKVFDWAEIGTPVLIY
jgi:lipoprotein-anchoring transpeptidase ErfK/SrfK